jgi:hypothetical protein
MQRVTDQARKRAEELAARYGFSDKAVLNLLEALVAGRGAMAQFQHAELGGMGQWTRGGMVMIGDMFNTALQTKVKDLCDDLAAIVDESIQPTIAFQAQRQDGAETDGAGSGAWWDAELGAPSSTGSQGNIRYAYFPATRRLAVSTGDRITLYDTHGHEITSFSQQHDSGATLTFASQHGPVPVSSLPVVATVGGEAADQATNAPTARDANHGTEAGEDVFSKIERLAELQQKGIVSKEEFAAKKAELLARL